MGYSAKTPAEILTLLVRMTFKGHPTLTAVRLPLGWGTQ